jgi:hypothetical protein
MKGTNKCPCCNKELSKDKKNTNNNKDFDEELELSEVEVSEILKAKGYEFG